MLRPHLPQPDVRHGAFAAAALVALAGCGDGEAPRGPPAPGTVQMAQRLQRLATEVAPWGHPYIRSARLDSALSVEVPEDWTRRLPFQANVAREVLRVGRIEEAVERFQELLAEARSRRDQVPARFRAALMAALGTAHLKLWERENCVLGRAIRPCLFPVRGRDGDPAPEAARSAAALHEALLEEALSEAGSDSLVARWLLNLSHMMAGDYPEGVPERLVIPPAALRPEHDVGRFPEVAPGLGLDVKGHAGGSVMDDFDGDGDLDVFASSWHLDDQLRFFRNQGDGTFTDATTEAGLEGITGGLNLAQADYDNDGNLDLLVLRGAWASYGEPNSLLRNDGDGTFEDVTEAAGLLSSYPTQTAAWGDYDGDGRLDLYVGNESDGDRRVPNQLFRNEGDGTFTEVAAEAGADLVGFVKAVVWGDVDNDGRLDLYVSRLGQPNVLFRNEGPDAEGRWTFSDATASAGVAEPIRSFPAWFWDYDNDGWLDLFVSGYQGTPGDVAAEYLGLPHGGETPRLYRNDGDGTFTDVTEEAALERVLLTMGSNHGDLDNDGFQDFYAGTGEANLQTIVPNRMFRNDGGGRFQDVTASGGFGHLGKGHAVAFGDLDGDGDQDVYATMGGAYDGDVARNVLFENPGHGNRWITLRLEGVASNRSALGARVRVVARTEAGRREIHRTVGAGGSFGANSLQQEIGLGRAVAVDTVEVAWPATGETDRFTGVAMDRVYRVREGAGSLAPVEAAPFRLGGGAGGTLP